MAQVACSSMAPFLLTLGVIAIIMLVMAVGVILGRRPLKGSCGGAEGIVGPDGEVIVCSNCGCGLAEMREGAEPHLESPA